MRQQQPFQDAFAELRDSDEFRAYPLQVRAAFQRVAAWLPSREASFPITQINASFAKMLRDKAACERGWRFGNQALAMLQIVVARAVASGVLEKNRVRQLPKILPPRQQSNQRRAIRPIRHRIPASTNSPEYEKSSG